MFMLSRRKNISRLDINAIWDVEAAPPSPSRAPGSARLGLKLIFILLLAVICASIFRGTSVTPTICNSDDPGSYIPDNVPRYHGPSVEFPERFTLIINSYKRHELLKLAIAHYSECSRIDAIRVVWAEDGLPPTRAAAAAFYSERKEVRYDIMPNASLNHRFFPLEGLRTAAVLSMDDDIQAPCTQLDRAFQAWSEQPRNMVGFYPRLHSRAEDCSYTYHTGLSTLTWHGAYSMVLTKAAFLHRDYLEVYTNHMARAIRDYVDRSRNCEDVAMSLLVANMTGAAPLWVPASSVVDLGQGLRGVRGISSAGSHHKARERCLDAFAKLYGGMPLRVRQVGSHQRPWLLRLAPVVDRLYAWSRGHV